MGNSRDGILYIQDGHEDWNLKMEKIKCKFVLTYAYCDWDVNGCIGVYDDPEKVMGEIIGRAIDIWDSSDKDPNEREPNFSFTFSHDDANDNYYDVEIRYKDSDKPDIYRVYYLRE